jgi:hypothetical protein
MSFGGTFKIQTITSSIEEENMIKQNDQENSRSRE